MSSQRPNSSLCALAALGRIRRCWKHRNSAFTLILFDHRTAVSAHQTVGKRFGGPSGRAALESSTVGNAGAGLGLLQLFRP